MPVVFPWGLLDPFLRGQFFLSLSPSPGWDQKSCPILSSAQPLADQNSLTSQKINREQCLLNIEAGDTEKKQCQLRGQRNQNLNNTRIIFTQRTITLYPLPPLSPSKALSLTLINYSVITAMKQSGKIYIHNVQSSALGNFW